MRRDDPYRIEIERAPEQERVLEGRREGSRQPTGNAETDDRFEKQSDGSLAARARVERHAISQFDIFCGVLPVHGPQALLAVLSALAVIVAEGCGAAG